MELEPAHTGNPHVNAQEASETNSVQRVGNHEGMLHFEKLAEADDDNEQLCHQVDQVESEPEPEHSTPSSSTSQESILAPTGFDETEVAMKVAVEEGSDFLSGRRGKSAAKIVDEAEEVAQAKQVMKYDMFAQHDTENGDNKQIHQIDLSALENSIPKFVEEPVAYSPSSPASSSSSDSSSSGDSSTSNSSSNSSSSSSSNSSSSSSAADSDSDSSPLGSELGLLESEPGNPPLFSPLWSWSLEPINESTEDIDSTACTPAAKSDKETEMMLRVQSTSAMQEDMSAGASILVAAFEAEPEMMLRAQSSSSVHEGEEVDCEPDAEQVACSAACKLDACRAESEAESEAKPEMMLRVQTSSSVQDGVAVGCEPGAEAACKLDARGAESRAVFEMMPRDQSSSSMQDGDRRPDAEQVVCSAACKLDAQRAESEAEPEMMLRVQRSSSVQCEDELYHELNAEQDACSAACKLDVHRPALRAVQFEKPSVLVASVGAEKIKGEPAVGNEKLSKPGETLKVAPHTPHRKIEQLVDNGKLSQPSETMNAALNSNLRVVPHIPQLPFTTSSTDASNLSERAQHVASFYHESVTTHTDAVESQVSPGNDVAGHPIKCKLRSVKPKTPRKLALATIPGSPREPVLPRTPPATSATAGAYSPKRCSQTRDRILAKTPRSATPCSATPGACSPPRPSRTRDEVLARTPRSVRASARSSETDPFCFDEFQNAPAIRFPSRSASVADQSSWPWSLWPSVFCTCTADNAILLEEEMPF